jgi:hypothetical protein
LLESVAGALGEFGDFSLELDSFFSFGGEILARLLDLLEQVLPLGDRWWLLLPGNPAPELCINIFQFLFVPLLEKIVLLMEFRIEDLEFHLVLTAARIDVVHIFDIKRLISLFLI